ncbi:MAG: phosphoethanolamine transferase [Candidatus Thioglobus sp.]|nr:MAG: phosphoethanolamine transferase [Candidatus Thioglobus sp.]
MKIVQKILIIWIGIIALELFVVRDFAWVLEHLTIKRVAVNFALTSLAMLSILFILRPIVSRGKAYKILIFAIIVVPMLVQMAHFEAYRSFATIAGFNDFSDDPLLVLNLWIENFNFVKSLIILLAIYALFSLLQTVKTKLVKWRYGLNVVAFVMLYLLTTFSWYGVSDFQNSTLAYYSTLLQMSRTQVLEFKRDKPRLVASQLPTAGLPNIVYVVGESLVLSHLGIYGYERDTTPKLQQLERNGQLLKYNNALSIGTHTRLSVPYMLTGIEGIDPSGKIYQTPSVLNYAKARGYSTAFISAQDTRWGHIKDLFVDADVDYFWHGVSMNKNASVHKGADDMRVLREIVLPYIDKISQQKKPFFLVLQMDGSHYPYAEHSGKEHKKFLPEDGVNSINAFDNTVVKTDDYLATLIKKMRSQYADSWLFYSTDHGQGLGGSSGKFNQNANINTIHNPLLVSAPKSAILRLLRNQNAPVSQADIVPSILHIIGMNAHKNINGKSLLGKINPQRLRIVSKYMPTQHNEPKATLVEPNLDAYYIDFEKMSVTFPTGKKTIKFKNWDKSRQQIFINRALPKCLSAQLSC